jgi:mevalonate kinase
MVHFETLAQGKLLLTGEYFVLDGALALALPVRPGQYLQVQSRPDGPGLEWISRDQEDRTWFQAEFDLPDLIVRSASDEKTAAVLRAILLACRRQNPAFLSAPDGLRVSTRTTFPREWGLGTSSTLIAATARWAGVDPYRVLFETLGGSGYDIACAYAGEPLLYRLENGAPAVQPAGFRPDFRDCLYFVYLGKKQDSREGIGHYRRTAGKDPALIAEISWLTRALVEASTLTEFDRLLGEHEALVARTLALPRACERYFPDFWGASKSLGAWGGDFVLVTSAKPAAETRAFFNEKGFSVFIPYDTLVL